MGLEMRLEAPFQERLNESAPNIVLAYQTAQEIITPDSLFDLASKLAAIRAPSGTVRYTLGPVIAKAVREFDPDAQHMKTNRDWLETGNPAIMINYSGDHGLVIPTIVLAHGDEVSYGPVRTGKSEIPLWANCAHRQAVPNKDKEPIVPRVSFPAEALRYGESEKGVPFLRQIAAGKIETDPKGNIFFVTEHGPEGLLQPGDRMVFNPIPDSPDRLIRDPNNPNHALGLIDNRIGLAASMLMGLTMRDLHEKYPDEFKDVGTIVVADDDEEGPPEGRFGKGAWDLANALNQYPNLRKSHYIVADGHDADTREHIVDDALLTESVSKGKGPITDPDRVNHLDQIVALITELGAKVKWDQQVVGVTTSRSSDNGLKMAGIPDKRIVVAGYNEAYPHHQGFNPDTLQLEPAAASIESAVQNARLLVALSVAGSRQLT